MNGLQTIRAVRETLPSIRAVLMTGYADDDVLDAHDERTALVRKPVALTDLVAVLAGGQESQPEGGEPARLRQSGGY
jgi:hypothetical protein